MDPTLLQILQRLFLAEQEIDRLRLQNQQLQAAYTDLVNEKGAGDAVSPAVG